MSKGEDIDEMDDEIGPRDLTRSALERMLAKALRRKKGGISEKPTEKDSEKANKEREDLADLSEEKKGKPPAVEVKSDDFAPEDAEEHAKDEKSKPFKKAKSK